MVTYMQLPFQHIDVEGSGLCIEKQTVAICKILIELPFILHPKCSLGCESLTWWLTVSNLTDLFFQSQNRSLNMIQSSNTHNFISLQLTILLAFLNCMPFICIHVSAGNTFSLVKALSYLFKLIVM